MLAASLPGGCQTELRTVPVPEAAPGQALLKVHASTNCGSDLRAIYREHLGSGAEAYRDVVGGHEPCGEIVAVGPGCRGSRVGGRRVVYHISGCGLCEFQRGPLLVHIAGARCRRHEEPAQVS
ncbi:alcohol dehydrogenase catalytic domain-containing protein [Streptomyces sp. NPDC048419]|uniref:alcohol dehydrogenase catalytic domain-containing protein n=1 Tax=Streptomyces sp. NPDC048419 TaxID=3365547 RepID=UPI00371263F6